MASELTEWRPFPDFVAIRHRLDQAFGDLFTGSDSWSPSVDVPRSMVLSPGVRAKDIEAKSEAEA